jgi:hypothetical protein
MAVALFAEAAADPVAARAGTVVDSNRATLRLAALATTAVRRAE